MFNIGFPEFAVIFIAALLLLGPQKLPEFARWIGRALREVRQATNEVRTAFDLEMEREEFERLQREFQHTIDTDLQFNPTAPEDQPPSPTDTSADVPTSQSEGTSTNQPSESSWQSSAPEGTIARGSWDEDEEASAAHGSEASTFGSETNNDSQSPLADASGTQTDDSAAHPPKQEL